jgi:hypothetical protein
MKNILMGIILLIITSSVLSAESTLDKKIEAAKKKMEKSEQDYNHAKKNLKRTSSGIKEIVAKANAKLPIDMKIYTLEQFILKDDMSIHANLSTIDFRTKVYAKKHPLIMHSMLMKIFCNKNSLSRSAMKANGFEYTLRWEDNDFTYGISKEITDNDCHRLIDKDDVEKIPKALKKNTSKKQCKRILFEKNDIIVDLSKLNKPGHYLVSTLLASNNNYWQSHNCETNANETSKEFWCIGDGDSGNLWIKIDDKGYKIKFGNKIRLEEEYDPMEDEVASKEIFFKDTTNYIRGKCISE